jgi:uncharacterized glyoxalase superfamily protein PhnB
VRYVRAAQEWYRDVLGLKINWLWEDNFGSVGRDNVELFLYRSDDPKPVYVSLFVADADAVYDEVRGRGATVVSELESKPWGMREFSVTDPDGNVLRIGHGEEVTPSIDRLTVYEAG